MTMGSFAYWKGLAQLTLGIRGTQGSHARLGQPGLLLGSHQWEAFPGTLLGSSTELSSQQHLGPPQLLCLQGSLGLLVFLRAQQLDAALHTRGQEGMEESWLPGTSSTVIRAVGLPQDTNMQLNTPEAPDNMLDTPQGCTCCLWDYSPSPGSVCLMFSGYCMATMLLWLR